MSDLSGSDGEHELQRKLETAKMAGFFEEVQDSDPSRRTVRVNSDDDNSAV